MVFIKHHSRKYATSPSCHRRRSGTSGYTSSIKGKDTSLIEFFFLVLIISNPSINIHLQEH